MADETQTVRSINWREVFPFTNLFKAFRVAVHPSKLVLALTALLLIYTGGRILDGVWMDKHLVTREELVYPSSALTDAPRGVFISFFDFEVQQVNLIAEGVFSLRFDAVVQGVSNFLIAGPYSVMKAHPLYFTLFALWFLLIWSVFGGAIARIAAVHVARDEKISVRQALRFSMNKLLSFGFAPLIPLLILLVLGAVVAIGGLLLYIPVIGPIVLSVVFFLALIAGLVMTLVLLGLVGGFNLMYPTIAVEGSDSFDAISRSFSYVFARPWRMLFYTLVAIVYGALTYTFVRFFIWLVLSLTHFFVGWWLTGQPETYWNGTGPAAAIWQAPEMNHLPYDVQYEGLEWSEDIAAGVISFWVYLVIGLLGAYAISFYFSANTIIYFLMRREVDATELEDVYVEESEDEFGEAAPVGVIPGEPAPAAPATSAPSGGLTGTAGSATNPAQSYTAPAVDAPNDPAVPNTPASPPESTPPV
jgi:hypothetical protein